MTNEELIAENNRLKSILKEIYSYTDLQPLVDDEIERKYYEEGNSASVFRGRLIRISTTVEFALVPDWYHYTREEREAFIASL